MSEKQFDELVEICLPAKLFRRSVGIAFDVGMYLNGNKCPELSSVFCCILFSYHILC